MVNYGTVNQRSQLVPLVEKGFERVERYRFCFKKDKDEISQLVIERAPERFTQGRVFRFSLGPAGIAQMELSRTMEDAL